MLTIKNRMLGLFGSALMAAALSAQPAAAASVRAPHAHAVSKATTNVTYSRARAWRHAHNERWDHGRPVRVDAPFTSVETRRYRYTAVDAPFASVRVHGGGVWVRAPFVNLYVPR